MKIKLFSPENVPNLRAGARTINIANNGQFTFSKTAVRDMALKPGAEIMIGNDEENPKDWFIVKHKGGFKLRSNDLNLKFNSSVLSKRISGSCKKTLPNTFLIGKEIELDEFGTTGWLIITASGKER